MTTARDRRNDAILAALNERHTGVAQQEYVRAVAKRFGVHPSTVYKVKQESGVTSENPPPTPEPPDRAGQAPTLLRVLQERGATRRGWAEASPRDLVTLTGIDIHDINKMLHQWHKLDIVKFTEHETHRPEGRISAIRLTQKGIGLRYAPGVEAPAVEPVEAPLVLEPAQIASAPTNGAAIPLPASTKPFLAEYPLLRRLLRRKALLLEAGRKAEEAGAEDVAIMLMERAENTSYTPEQAEMIRFLLDIYPAEATDVPVEIEQKGAEPIHAS